jgi:8-amino-7-oxononanoate synthase
MANLAIMTTLFDKQDVIIQDKLNHASLIDGALASDARHYRFKHCNQESLHQQLVHQQEQSRFLAVATDGVFSMDGDLAPLPEYIPIIEQHSAILIVDDAHGIGVLGETGGGSKQHFELTSSQLPILMGTMGKAL